MQRRHFVRRLAIAAGVLVGGIGALAVADADRGDDSGRPLFVRRLRPHATPSKNTSGVDDVQSTEAVTTVFLPGLGGTTDYWEYVLTAGTEAPWHGNPLLVDLLGFGRSPKPWTTYTVARHVAELRRVLARYPRLTLVGHSIGARLAIAYAAQFPEQIERLVLVSVPYFGGPDRARRFFGAKGASGWIWTHLVPIALTCLLSRRVLGWAFPMIIPSVPAAVAVGLTQMTWRSSTSTIWEVMYGHDLTADLRRVPTRVPFTCLHGARDQSAPLTGVQALRMLHPNSTLVVQAEAGHQLPLRFPGWVREHAARAS